MYGHPPETMEWDGVAPDETAVFDDSPETEYDSDRTPWWRPSGFVEWFALGQTLLPALLFLPGSQPYRLPIRTGAYVVSLCAFAIWWFDRGGRGFGFQHPGHVRKPDIIHVAVELRIGIARVHMG